MRFDCVLFDHDETLVSTFALRAVVMERTSVEVLGREIDGAACLDASHGKSLEQMAADLAGGDADTAARFVERYRSRYYADNRRELAPFAGIEESLVALAAAGVRIGVVTAKLGRGAREELESTGLARHVETVVGSEDVTRSKPDAEPLLRALAALGVEPGRALMIGDTSADLLGARAAGTASAAALWGAREPQALIALAPDYAFEHPSEVLAAARGGFAAPGARR